MTNQELWKKEFRRIQRLARNISKGTNIVFTFPKQPKRVEKESVERLRKITPQKLRELVTKETSKARAQDAVTIDIQKAARTKEPDEPKKGYRYQAITPEERSRRAKKAAETRKARGIKPFGDMTPEERSARAKKAAATRKAKGITPFGNMTPEQRSARAKKAAATRRANKFKRINGDKVEIIHEETGEIEQQPIEDNEEVPNINEYNLIIENYLQQLAEYQNMHPQAFFINIIIDKLTDLKATFGEKKMAIALAKMADEGILVTVLVVYDTDGAGIAYLGKMISFLTGNGVMTGEEGTDIFMNVDANDSSYFDYMGGEEEEEEYLNRTYIWTDGV